MSHQEETEELSGTKGDWTSELFVWDPNWEGYWGLEDLEYQLQERKQWFAILT